MKETVIQFGEGGFLRSFVDYFFNEMLEQNLYDGKIVVVQPIENGKVDILNQQHGEYYQILRGKKDGKTINLSKKITSISRGINPYTDYEEYLKLAHNKDARVIVSNTTEAGIEYLGTEMITDKPPKSFPAKLTVLLYERYKAGLLGYIILSCELIDNNGCKLKECVLKYAKLWKLEPEFIDWINKNNSFCNTLVDRICTGYPKDEAEELCRELGIEDRLLNTAEIFHLWVIEGDFENEIPLKKAGINVIWTKDVSVYKKRKVRILNGAHTSMVLAAHLCGLDTVGECINDSTIAPFLQQLLFEEIVPCIGNSQEDIQFAKDVIERFSNPFIKHKLLSIALNSVSKFRVRVLPTILESYEANKKLPKCLTFSLAALITFYKEDKPNDSVEIMEFMKNGTVEDILSKEEYWGRNLTFMKEDIERYIETINKLGMREAIECL